MRGFTDVVFPCLPFLSGDIQVISEESSFSPNLGGVRGERHRNGETSRMEGPPFLKRGKEKSQCVLSGKVLLGFRFEMGGSVQGVA